METRAHHVLIGTFVLLAALLGLAFTLWITKASFDEEFDEYEVVFNETVTGLTKGAAVNFNGIQVGEVRRLSLDHQDGNAVLALIRVAGGTPVRQGTSATLTYTGLTGVAIIELVGGAAGAPPLLPAEGQSYARILATPSALQRFMTGGSDVLLRFNDALARLSALLNDDNLDRIGRTLAHVESVAAELDRDKAEVAALLGSAQRALDEVAQGAAALGELGSEGAAVLGRADAMLARDLAPAAEDLRATLLALRSTSARIDGMLQAHQQSVGVLAEQGLPAVGSTLNQLESLARRLERLSEGLERGPSDYLLQRDRPAPYRPASKEPTP